MSKREAVVIKDEEVTYSLEASFDDIPVRGNVMASGDDEADRAEEDAIIARLESGDVWAWAHVVVTAHWRGFVGHDSIGGCCNEDEADFKAPGGYYDDMRAQALENLKANVADVVRRLEGK